MEPSSYSGAGGKIRRRPTSRASASTPYDRPPAAAAAHRLAAAAAAAGSSAGYQGTAGGEGEGEGGSWVSRLVDPASRLIAGGAARLFSTVFRKRFAPAPAHPALEPPASAPPGRDAEPKQDLPESTRIGFTPAGGMAKGKDPVGASGDKALSEVEHLLMRKTFTKVEFDRLTDLLRARTVEPDSSAQVDHHVDKTEKRTQIDGTGGSTSHGMAVDHSPPANIPVRGVTSPADLAKQYMSSRYLKEPQPSMRNQVFSGNRAEAGNTGYYRTSGAPLVQELKEFNNENPGLPVNGYMASGPRGRSAISRMSRSPFFKGPSDMNPSPFSSSYTRTSDLAADGRQALKRRGTDFENERGSIGPIRRIRQKSNMMSHFRDSNVSPRGNFPPSRTIGPDFAEGSSPLQESPSSKRLLLETGKSLWTVGKHRNSEDGKSSSDNVLPVPPQPNKMAQKIFEQLDIIAPSPKDKQSGQRSNSGIPSQSMSKQPVWQDNGPKGLSDPSSSRQFQDLDGARPNDSDLNGSTLNKDKLKKDESSKFPSNTFEDSGNKDMKSDHAGSFYKPAISGNSVSATTSRKPGFKMAVFEDLYEFDDDQEPPVQSKNPILETEVKTTEQKFNSKRKERNVQDNKSEQKVELTLSKGNSTSSSVSEQPKTSTSKDVSTSGLFSSSDPEKKATPHVPANNNIGFTFPHVPPGGKTEATGSAVPLASDKDNKQTTASPFMFGAKPSSTSGLETSTTAGVKTEGRLGESITKPSSLDSTNLERSNGTERAGDIHKSPDKALPTAPPTSTPPLHSSAASTPNLSNGLSHASPPKFSNVTPTDKPAVSSAPFTNITSFAVSSSSPPISSPVPAFPTIKFGSSTSAVAAAKSESTSTETKPASTSFFGTVGTSTESKSVAPDPASKTSSNLNTASIFSSNVTTFSSSPLTSSSTFSSTATFSSSPVASSSVGIASTDSAPSTTLTAPAVQSASTPAFAFSSSGNSIFGFSSTAQSTGLSTTVGGSTSQASAASTIFGSKLPQPQGTVSQSSATQFSSSFPTMATGAAASSSGPGTLLFGAGASSSGPGTVSFGVGASSSGPGSVSIGVGASSSGPGLFSFGAGVSSSGPGTVSFGAAPSLSAPGTVSFGATTSSSGPAFGNSPFGSGAAFSGSGSGFAFSSPSSSAASSLTVASTSMFSSSSAASSSAAFSNPFGSTSSAPSMFTFGQPASSGAGFSFGAQSAPAFSSPSPPAFSFTSASMNSSTPQPAFGTTNANTGFGMGSPGNDQMNMEDSMADDTNQAAPAPVFGSSLFGQPASSPAPPVFGAPAPAAPVFGAPAAAQTAGVFQFGGQQGSMPQQQNPSFAPAGGSVEFQGGTFSLGSTGGGDKSGRRIIKPRRTQKKK